MSRRGKKIDVPLLCKLWADTTVDVSEIARRIGFSVSRMYQLRQEFGLPKRPFRTKQAVIDPTPEEIAKRARECREKHYEQRRAESDEATRSKLSRERRDEAA
jgi:RNA polymerase subunit RPABC4/transcription elongation factor Spt4